MQLFWRDYWDAVDAQHDIPLTQSSLLGRISLGHANNDRTRHRLAILCNSTTMRKSDAEVGEPPPISITAVVCHDRTIWRVSPTGGQPPRCPHECVSHRYG